MERWVVNNAKVGDGSVNQTVELPNGTYTLTVAAHNIQQNDPASPQTGACIFADDTQTPVGSPADYSVTFTVVEGRVTVGFRAEGATGSYIACDNFRLYLVDNSREAVLKELQARVDQATALAADKMQQDAATELQAAASAAQQLVGTPADEEIPTAAIRLRAAYEAAKESAQAYADLQAAIDEALAAYNEAGKGAAELDQAIQDAQAAAANLSATPEDLAGDLADLTRAALVYNVANSASAACSYGGNMGVGPNSYYQRPGTLMHEMGHAIGEGQHGMWWSEILRDEESLWLGDQANGVVQFWENDPTARVHTDDMHKSPYGINGAWEDDGTDVLYIANGLMTQGFGVDGLPPTGGFATPGYVFEQEDDVKYYLKSESEDYGLYTSYLFEGANRLLRWKEATADVATANDSAAWYITFDPVSQHYMFRNAATGNYLTYNTSGTNGFRTIAKDVPGLTEKLHLLKGRVNVTAGRARTASPRRATGLPIPTASPTDWATRPTPRATPTASPDASTTSPRPTPSSSITTPRTSAGSSSPPTRP